MPWSPSFSSVFLYGFLWPSRSPAGPGLPFPYAIWVLYPVGSSPSARVFPLWLFLFYHRVDVLWFLLSLQALVSRSTFACLSRVCSLSHALPPSLAAPFLRTVCSFSWGYFILLASPLSCLGSLSGFFTRFSQSVDVGQRSSLGQTYSFLASSFPWGYSPLPLLALHSIILFTRLVLLLLFHGTVSSTVVAPCCLCALSFRFPCGVRSFSELRVFSARLSVLSFFSAPCFLILG